MTTLVRPGVPVEGLKTVGQTVGKNGKVAGIRSPGMMSCLV